MVKDQLSFEVVLLDSSAFPSWIMRVLRGPKSTHKVLAASHSSYIKLTGKSSPEKATPSISLKVTVTAAVAAAWHLCSPLHQNDREMWSPVNLRQAE